MTRRWSKVLFALALCVLAGCVPVSNELDADAEVVVDFNDPSQRALYDAQDRLLVDTLIAYLQHERPELRYLAARGFASVQSDRAVAPLTQLLLDPIDEVRAMAAYALGQQDDADAQEPLLLAFDARDTLGAYAKTNSAILEAVGKIGDSTALKSLATISTYRATDTLLALGQARGIYRFALRNLTIPEGTQTMIDRATDRSWPREVRLMAAHYLQRADVDLTGFGESLLKNYRRELDPQLRMALARALGKAKEPGIAEALASSLRREKNAIARVEIVRGLGQQPFEIVRPALLGALRDENPLVRETAADQLREHATAQDAGLLWRTARDSMDGIASAKLYAAALRHMPISLQEYRRYINYELRRGYGEVEDPYIRAAILRALAEAPWNYRFLVQEALGDASTVERTAASEALNAIARQPGLPRYFGTSFPTVKRELGDYAEQVMDAGDAGQMALVAEMLAIPELNFQTEFETLDFIRIAKSKLQLPRETETAYALEDALAALDRRYEARKPTPGYNHEINWDIYRSLQPGLVVELETSRGRITIDLLEEVAPGTVVNFVQSVRNGFYNGKRFHRIVPAFVTQGGGPRGDGYGSLDYTIRSELAPAYYDDAGYVGMASAGRHTEGVQFFFTHQPTPHLDGRYTIFGRVAEGMDAVLALRPGDDMRVRLR